MSPAINQQEWVQTWVTYRWKNPSIPGQFSAEINTVIDKRLELLRGIASKPSCTTRQRDVAPRRAREIGSGVLGMAGQSDGKGCERDGREEKMSGDFHDRHPLDNHGRPVSFLLSKRHDRRMTKPLRFDDDPPATIRA
jgi:hypothetical protein